MGFSRYCPSSLDLTNFVVWRYRGGIAQVSPSGALAGPGLAQASVGESGNLGIWKSKKSKNILGWSLVFSL